MHFGTLGEGIILWGFCSGLVGFFIGFKKIFIVNIVVTILIMLGFFFGIGIHVFRIMFL